MFILSVGSSVACQQFFKTLTGSTVLLLIGLNGALCAKTRNEFASLKFPFTDFGIFFVNMKEKKNKISKNKTLRNDLLMI